MRARTTRWLLVLALAALLAPAAADARPPVPAHVFKAVRAYWKAPAERVKAFDVVACETGNTYDTDAQNGQYLGMFQMGSWERSQFGHGRTAGAQARAAHRYYSISGWSPWSCA